MAGDDGNGEAEDPERTVASLYLPMNVTIIGVPPWREEMHSTSIVSDFMERLYGAGAGRFAVLLEYSRVSFAAFGRLHGAQQFPNLSVVLMDALLGWLYVLIARGLEYIGAGVGLLAAGFGAYLVGVRRTGEWPLEREVDACL